MNTKIKAIENSNINLLLLIVANLTVGCATGVSPKEAKVDSVAVGPAIKAENYQGISDYEKVSSSDCPSNDISWKKESAKNLIKYANACYILNKPQRLNSIADHLAQVHHKTPWGPYYLSLGAQLNGDSTRALWMIELAIKKSPKTALFYYQKGRLLWTLGEQNRAVENYKLALKENSQFDEVNLFLGQLYFKEQNFKESQVYFSALVNGRHPNGAAYASLGEVRLNMGDKNSALELFEKAVNASPRNITYRMRLGSLYETTKKDYEAALAMYKKVKDLTSEKGNANLVSLVELNDKIKGLEKNVATQKSAERKLSQAEKDE